MNERNLDMRSTNPASRILLLAFLMVPALGFGQDPDYVLSLPTTSAIQGETVLLTVGFDNTGNESIQAFSFGVCHVPESLELLEATEVGTTTETISGGGLPDFLQIDTYIDGWTIGVVIDFFGIEDLGPGVNYTLGTGIYKAIGTPNSATPVEICDTLGSPSVLPWIVVNGASIVPTQIPGEVTIESLDAPFMRGETTGDGNVNISDPMVILMYLFNGESHSCLDALDSNDDGNLSISDAMYLLCYLFCGESPTIPAPFGSCGYDNTADPLGCVESPGGTCP